MMEMPLPLTRDLVLIGGGHTHALVLRMLGMEPIPGVRLTLINPFPTAAYSGMLPGFVAGHYEVPDLGIDLVRLARFAGARLILGRASGIDLGARTVTVEGRPPLRFDVASIDIGISSEMPGLPGFAEHAVPAKPLDTFARRWAAFAGSGEAGRVAVIGGGIAGMEIALAAAYRLRGRGSVTVVEAGKGPVGHRRGGATCHPVARGRTRRDGDRRRARRQRWARGRQAGRRAGRAVGLHSWRSRDPAAGLACGDGPAPDRWLRHGGERGVRPGACARR